jgi:hypothetical protein
MTTHTVSLERQGKPAERMTLKRVFEPVIHPEHNQCEHEVRTRRGVFRRCRRAATMHMQGKRVCTVHAHHMRD